MIVRPVIGSTTSLTIAISMKRTQITPLLLSQESQNFSLANASSRDNKIISPFSNVPMSRPVTKRFSTCVQSLSSADSGIHSTDAQNPSCALHSISFGYY